MESAFKTNIKCSACVAKVTPFLNEVAGENQWQVDLSSPQRTLIVRADVAESVAKEALTKGGYVAEKIQG